MNSKIQRLEKETFEENDSPDQPPQDIVAYSESRSCADLYRMFKDEVLAIQPEFQREVVWKTPAQTRFIDSLIKQLPIPSLCFSMDYKTTSWQVIDGLQRVSSIFKFLGGDPNWTLSKLEDIDPVLSGARAGDFKKDPALVKYYKRVENLTLPITVLRCDYSKKAHTNYLFTIFHRLNTGAMKLNNQEIRNCIYAGVFNDLLKSLNENKDWMKLNRMKAPKILVLETPEESVSGEAKILSDAGYRFTKEELILRFFAFYDDHKNYGGRLAKFLNEYMDDKKKAMSEDEISEKTELFERTVKLILFKIFYGSAPIKTPISIIEATLVGIAKNIDDLEKKTSKDVRARYEKLLRHNEFSEEKLSEGLSGKLRVTGRIDAAIKAFR